MSIPSDSRERFYQLAGDVLEILLRWMRSTTATNIGRRVELLSKGVYLPGAGAGDSNTVAACLNVSENAIDHMAVRNKLPSKRPGQSRLFQFADVVTYSKTGGKP